MNNEEAKFRLRAYRPGGQDATDATLGEALAHADRDPALRAWLAREQAFDATIAAKLGELAPPPGLREAILSGVRAAPRRPLWQRRAGWTLAAMAAGLIALAVLWPRAGSPDGFEALARFAIEDSQHGQHGGRGEATSALQVTLANPATRLTGPLPVNFSNLSASGCRSLSFAGREVLEVCFAREGLEFHLYITPRGDLPELRAPRALALGRSHGLVWHDAKFAYALVGEVGSEALKRLL